MSKALRKIVKKVPTYTPMFFGFIGRHGGHDPLNESMKVHYSLHKPGQSSIYFKNISRNHDFLGGAHSFGKTDKGVTDNYGNKSYSSYLHYLKQVKNDVNYFKKAYPKEKFRLKVNIHHFEPEKLHDN